MLTIYKASAGSGKTFFLAQRYLIHLLGTKNKETGKYSLNKVHGKNARRILAVTFTNKATEQMKSRIVKELAQLAYKPEKSEHIKDLDEVFGTGGNYELISDAAKKELEALIFNFSDFNISTIDSFFQQVLRNFAAEINRPATFDIELDSKLALTESADSMFSELTRPELFKAKASQLKILTRWLMQFITKQIEDGASFNIFNREGFVLSDVVKIVDSLMNEKYSLNSAIINDYLENPERLIDFLDDIKKRKSTYITDLRKLASDIYDFVVADTGNYELSGCKLKKEWLQRCIKSGDFKENLPKAAESDDFNIDKFFYATKKGVNCIPVSGKTKQAISDFVSFYKQSRLIARTFDSIEKRLFYLGILSPLIKVLKTRCIDSNTILIKDTNEFLHKIIGNSLSPFIYDKIGTTFRHYLIDEFQDTSQMQWENFMPLMVESLSTDEDNLIIGDEKQCIYRFRNSEPELLGHKVDREIRERLRNEKITDILGTLARHNTNYRSSADVIRFNNSLFCAMSGLPELKEFLPYKNVIQHLKNGGDQFRGYVKVRFIGDGAEKKEEIEPKALELMIDEVARMLKVYNPKDIAILVRKNSEAATVMNALLEAMDSSGGKTAKLPVFNIVSGQALEAGVAKSVKMIIDILRIVDSPASMLGNSNEERILSKGNHLKADLSRLVHHYHIALSNGESPDIALKKAADPDSSKTDALLDRAMNRQSFDLIGTIERVISEIPYDDRKKDAIFIAAFQDCVVSYMERGGGDIHTFLEWWDTTGSKTPVDSPENTNSLTISTIHKSKGIEYQCVIIPFMSYDFIKESNFYIRDIRWYNTEGLKGIGLNPDNIPPLIPMEKNASLKDTVFAAEYLEQNNEQRIDNLNVTYVATTRAKEELVIISFKTSKQTEPVSDYLLRSITGFKDLTKSIKTDANLICDLESHYDPTSRTLELGTPRSKHIEIEREEKRNEYLRTLNEDEQKEFLQTQKDSTPQKMPDFKTVERRERLRLGKLQSSEKYDPDQARLLGKYGLSKIGTDEAFLPKNARVIGDFLHEVLSMTHSEEDLDYALTLKSEEVMLSEELKKKYSIMLKDAVNQPFAKKWFNNTLRVITERPLAIKGNDKTVVRRPDRVVWTEEGGVDVIDFKFGKPEKSAHSKQVSDYVRFLRSTGITNVKGYIWYISEGSLVEIG